MDRDPVADALRELAAAARANILEWQGALDRIDAVLDQRAAGVSYGEMDAPVGPSIISSVNRNQERLATAASAFRRALARQLADDGWSQAAIAEAFGVTRQRIAALLDD